ncbi:hypothetical protein [Solilutibacter silvestris]|uniref:hypothetical protein n=1 Tax=Solilutibacter silvestris TaxID=1645665 RepID=UPI003D34F2B2
MKKQPLLRPAIGTALLLAIPMVMTIIDHNQPQGKGWHWGLLDFAVMGVLLMAAGTSYELVSARMKSTTQRVALGVVVSGVVLAIWVELAVGGISQLIGWTTA